jgi:hypothetical protein
MTGEHEENEHVPIMGREIVLGSGAVVRVGRTERPDDGVFLEFINAGGTVTRVRLSVEAALALERLLTGTQHQRPWTATLIPSELMLVWKFVEDEEPNPGGVPT